MKLFVRPAQVILFAFLVVQAFYALKLQHDFHREHAPFFDSCGYSNQLLDVAETTRTLGLAAGLRAALAGNVALPYLEMVPLARWLRPDRSFGVWLQWIWLVVFAGSLFWYLTRWRGIGPWTALCLVLPLVSFARIYDWNSGLSDFRMDLSLYIFVSLFSVWFLITYETDAIYPWLLAGLAAGLCVLARATSPVYLLVAFGPLLAIRIARASNRRALLLRCLIMGVPAAIAIAAFLVPNYTFLHFYYVEWSPDANRHLPFLQAATHILLAGVHMGVVMAVISAVALGIGLVSGGRWNGKRLDWRLVWLAAAPTAFLVFRGAGLNPYVSMPSVFGAVLFCYLPLRFSPRVPRAVCVCAVAASLYNAATATQPQLASGPNVTRIAAIRDLVDRMAAHATPRDSKAASYVLPVVGDFYSCSVNNVLRYEYRATPQQNGFRIRPDFALAFPNEGAYTASDEFLWKRYTPAATDQERFNKLVAYASREVDFLILPTPDTIAWLEKARAYNYINLRVGEMRNRWLTSGGWRKIGDPVQFTPAESYELYQRTGGVE